LSRVHPVAKTSAAVMNSLRAAAGRAIAVSIDSAMTGLSYDNTPAGFAEFLRKDA
jgi:hypothetical protein